MLDPLTRLTDSLFRAGAGFRFISTQKWGVEYDRTRIAPILHEFYDAGERMNDIRFITSGHRGCR